MIKYLDPYGFLYRYCASKMYTLPILKGSWELVTSAINKVTILIIAYNPN